MTTLGFKQPGLSGPAVKKLNTLREAYSRLTWDNFKLNFARRPRHC